MEWIDQERIGQLLCGSSKLTEKKDTVIFDPLSRDDLRGIIEIQLRSLARLLVDKRVGIEVTDAAKDRLVDLGYEPAFGARPLKRVILKHLQDPLAENLLRGGYGPGDTVHVDIDGDGFSFEKRSAECSCWAGFEHGLAFLGDVPIVRERRGFTG